MRLVLVSIALFTAMTQFSCGDYDEDTVVNRTPSGGPTDDTGGIDTLSEEELAQRIDRLDGQIRTMVSNKSCSSDEQCKSIAYGFKACGGPEGYHIYSTEQTDESVLQARVSAYTAADRRLDEIRGGASDCEFVCEPIVGCTGGNCAPQTGAGCADAPQ